MSAPGYDRNAARMAHQDHMVNGGVPMGAPPGPRLRSQPTPGAPGTRVIPRPTPPHIKPVGRLTGPNPKVPMDMDPVNRYKNNEKMSGEPASSDEYSGIRNLVALLLFVVLGSSVFVMPEKYRFFWLILVGFSALMMIGFRIYNDLYEASKDETKDEKERDKYSNFAGAVIRGEFILYSVVMAALLLVFAWKLYGQVNSRSNLLSNTEPENDQQTKVMETRLDSAMMDDERRSRRMERKRKRDPMYSM